MLGRLQGPQRVDNDYATYAKDANYLIDIPVG